MWAWEWRRKWGRRGGEDGGEEIGRGGEVEWAGRGTDAGDDDAAASAGAAESALGTIGGNILDEAGEHRGVEGMEWIPMLSCREKVS